MVKDSVSGWFGRDGGGDQRHLVALGIGVGYQMTQGPGYPIDRGKVGIGEEGDPHRIVGFILL